jgi:hypothetical protein
MAKTTTHGHTSDDCPIDMFCQYWDEGVGSWLTYTDLLGAGACDMATGVTFELTDADICSDSDLGVLDTQGNGCSSYSDRSDCGKYDDPDGTTFVAGDMCCQCGGGNNCIDTDTSG